MQPPPPPTPREWLRAGALFALAAAAVFSFHAVPPQPLLGARFGDMAAIYWFFRTWSFDWIAQGVLPMWNPHVFCGNAFLANPETALFYPPNWLHLALPHALAINAIVIAHVWASGLFAWRLARHFACGAAGAAAAGAIYMLGSGTMARAYIGHITILCTTAWLPLVAWMALRCSEAPGPRAIAAGAIAYGLMCLAGHPQMAYFGSLWIAAVCLLRAAARPRREWPAAVAAPAAMAILGAGIAAIQWLPTAMWLPRTERAAADSAFSLAYGLHPEALLELLAPQFFGDGTRGPYWGRWYYWEMALYAGCATVPLATAAVARALKHRDGRGAEVALAASSAAFFALACAPYLPGGAVLQRLIPGLGLFRAHARFAIPAMLGVAMLAGLAISVLETGAPRFRKALGGTLFVWGACAAVLSFSFPSEAETAQRVLSRELAPQFPELERVPRSGNAAFLLHRALAPLAFRQATAAAAWSAMAGLLLLVAAGWFPGRRVAVAATAFCVVELCIAMRPLVAWHAAGDAARPSPYGNLGGIAREAIDDPEASPNGAMAFGFLTASGYEPLAPASPLRHAIGDPPGGPTLRPRAFLLGNGIVPPAGDLALHALRESTTRSGISFAESDPNTVRIKIARPRTHSVYEHPPPPPGPQPDNPAPGFPLQPPPANAPPLVLQETRVEPEPPYYLALQDTAAPGWSVEVGGAPAAMLPGYLDYRVVALGEIPDAGVEVTFRYRTPGLTAGIMITLVSLVAAATLAFRKPAQP